jgi:ribonucleoside-triphosphate reductase
MTLTTALSFKLNEDFLEPYRTRKVNWGYKDAAGNALGEITFLRTYSRKLPDGSKERWWQVCQRVIEGMFSIQRDHCEANRLPWNGRKAQITAQDAFERLFTFRWTPPGRGLWMMGTPLVNEHRNSAALQNCAMVSTGDMTKKDPAGPFTFLMEASMLGIGVGFDTKGADKGFTIFEPIDPAQTDPMLYVIPDTREGWVESVRYCCWSPTSSPASSPPVFDYTQIRPAGEPIKTFGGTAAGPEPLMRLHEGYARSWRTATARPDQHRHPRHRQPDRRLRRLRQRPPLRRAGHGLHRGQGLPRRQELRADGPGEWVAGPAAERAEWGWMSNNSVAVNVGDDLTPIIDGIARNGEPGVIWLDVSRQYGRLIDPPTSADHRVAGYNPCAEQSLESFECCTLVETYLNRHDDLDDFKRTLKVAYLYAKTVTLLPTHWERPTRSCSATGASAPASPASRTSPTTTA